VTELQPTTSSPTAIAASSAAPRPQAIAVSAIVVSYNTRQMTIDCLRSLYADLGDLSAEVFVVDNASTDGSADAIREQFPSVHLIANRENRGFGAANNQAMSICRGDTILLLNSDAFPRPGAVSAMLRTLKDHPQAAVAGPRLLNADGSLQTSCYRFPSPLQAWLENLWISRLLKSHPRIGDYRYWAHDSVRDVDWLIGACMLIRREAYEQLGGFDERFFMYAEETDWQKRMRSTGWQILFTPEAQVVHLGGASGKDDRVKISNEFFRSLDTYTIKHHRILGLLSLRMAMVIGCSIRAILWAIMAVAAPNRRSHALAKLRQRLWLVWRQMTCWHGICRGRRADPACLRVDILGRDSLCIGIHGADVVSARLVPHADHGGRPIPV
jgi:GT2 family glycosyltransferase